MGDCLSRFNMFLYLPRQKSGGQTRLLPLIFPPQRRWQQTWGHLGQEHILGDPEIRVRYGICFSSTHMARSNIYSPWNLLSRLDTSSTASLTAWTGSDMIWWMSENNHTLLLLLLLRTSCVSSNYGGSREISLSCDPPGTVLYSTKSNMTTPTTTQDRRAARAISSSADIFSFPRSPQPLERREFTWGGAATPLDPVAAGGRERGHQAFNLAIYWLFHIDIYWFWANHDWLCPVFLAGAAVGEKETYRLWWFWCAKSVSLSLLLILLLGKGQVYLFFILDVCTIAYLSSLVSTPGCSAKTDTPGGYRHCDKVPGGTKL